MKTYLIVYTRNNSFDDSPAIQNETVIATGSAQALLKIRELLDDTIVIINIIELS